MNKWRKLDNTAKIFSLEAGSNINIFRYSVVLKEEVNKDILTKALKRTLEDYSFFKVKIETGFFWNYLEFNPKEVLVEEEDNIPCQLFDFRRNNDYLFKVTYYKNKINLEVFHVLTDGNGAARFLKDIIYNYLNLKNSGRFVECVDNKELEYHDQYLKNFDKTNKTRHNVNLAFQIKRKINDINNTYHYTTFISDIKKVSRKFGVSITEYLTALYIYAMYTSIYDGKSGREIIITVPIDLRKYYGVDTLSNFFACMDINPKLMTNGVTDFEEVIKLVHKEFKNKLTIDKVKGYLNRDVGLGQNIYIRLVPLFIKKIFINFMSKVINRTVTSTVSNVGIIEVDKKYKKYIDNIYVLVLPGRVQKIKCTICSFDEKINITINSNIDDLKFQKRFYEVFKEHINNITIISNNDIKFE